MKAFKKGINKYEMKRLNKAVRQILSYEEEMMTYSDKELRSKTEEFKATIKEGKTLDDILPESFALVREAAGRVLGMKHYPVQLMGGIVLHQGRIAQMRTGEGKTLVSTLPAYLNALKGKGVHIVTVNDYLAKRDAELMGCVHEFLGLRVGVITSESSEEERRQAYACDITYITNSELGFDYLRDNMTVTKNRMVQRGLYYALIDEVDSVLIDEARTPLIISGKKRENPEIYHVCDLLAKMMTKGSSDGVLSKMDALMGIDLEEDGDFVLNEKDKYIMLTARGVEKTERYFHIDNLSKSENMEIQHGILMALRANYLMHKDQDYVVKDDKVMIVDEFTGRIMPDRRYADGLHQAIEAKEKLEIQQASSTLATIAYQHFFNKYHKKGGMTGTGITEEKEFREIYAMDVVEIPTNKPVIRKDLEDAVYLTKREKMQAVLKDIQASYKKGQPVLVGTASIDSSEEISRMLVKHGIPHTVLNAKFHEKEAEIISHAGEKKAVTIATNMAGRGTDIKLGEGVARLGGLKVIGTQRHESRRIDNQLCGRAGRQGDPGESRFYLSLEDDLLRLFGTEKTINMYRSLGIADGEKIEHKSISKAVMKAQKRIEDHHYGIRKSLMEYDQVGNDQREILYQERQKVLVLNDIHPIIENMIEKSVMEEGNSITEEKAEKYKEYAKEQELQSEIERRILLKIIDEKWKEHIIQMEMLRQSIGLQIYAQRDPVLEYKLEAYQLFQKMTEGIRLETVKTLLYSATHA